MTPEESTEALHALADEIQAFANDCDIYGPPGYKALQSLAREMLDLTVAVANIYGERVVMTIPNEIVVMRSLGLR